MVCGASLVISATCAIDRAGGYSDDKYGSELPACPAKTEVWSVAWTYAFCNRPIACRTGQVAKETYVFVNGAPAPRGMYRCRGVRRCVFVPVLQLSSQGSVRARICTSSRYSPSIRRFIDGFPCRFFFAPPMPARSVERPQRGISALSLALPGNVNRGYFRSDGLPMQPEKKLAV